MSPPKVVRSAFGVFFEYDTPRIVHIRSKKVGIINRFLQLVIIGYVIGYAIVWKKGYQEFDSVKGAVTTKLKGVAYTNFSNIPGLDGRIWDVGDYVIPPQENGAFFVMTNVLVTPDQIQGVCEEDPTILDAVCNNKTCIPGELVINGNGVKTGNCIQSTRNSSVKVCEIHAWCPVERDDNTTRSPEPALEASRNFTVFIKNNIEFPKFDVLRRNIVGFQNDSQLSECRFNASDTLNKYCPIFFMSDLIELAGFNYSDVTQLGAVIQVVITWDCNLDYSEEDCLPEYSFRRLDRGDYKISKGFNFRYADHYKIGNVSARTLYKASGIRFVVTVQGEAGKFSLVPLVTNIGAGMAILSIATVICDIIVLYIMKARTFYRENKYLDVKGDDAYEGLEESESDVQIEGPRQRQPVHEDGSPNRSYN